MAKPRTNADAAAFWAESAQAPELPDAIDVNSVGIKNRAVFIDGERRYWRTSVTSFGWYEMGVIVREASQEDPSWAGKVLRIVTNADNFPCKGRARTPDDQNAVDFEARQLSAMTGVPVERIPLTASHLYGGWTPNGIERYAEHLRNCIQVLPRDSDPEPLFTLDEVPPFYNSVNPGPEPVDTGEGCEAGRIEEYEYTQVENLWVSELGLQDQAYTVRMESDLSYTTLLTRPGDFFTRNSADQIMVTRAYTGTIVWGSKDYAGHDEYARPFLSDRDRWSMRRECTYRQCQHCAEFQKRHAEWHRAMHGGYRMGRNKGWATYSALVHTYGSEDGWRNARREFVRAQRAFWAEHRAWSERNFIPHSALSTDRHGLPAFNEDGYALRKDGDAYLKVQRADERAERRRRREREARERHERQVERFRRGIQRRRRKSFLTLAQEVAQNLASVSAELQSTDTERLGT